MKKLLFLVLLFPELCYSEMKPFIAEGGPNIQNIPVTPLEQAPSSGSGQQTNPPAPSTFKQPQAFPPFNISLDFNQPIDQVSQQVQQAKMKLDIMGSFLENFVQVLRESDDMRARELQLYTAYADYQTQLKQLASMGPQNFKDKYGFSIDQSKDKYIQLSGSVSPTGQKAFKYAEMIVAALSKEGFLGGISPKVSNFLNYIKQQLATATTAASVKAPKYSNK